MRDSLGIEIVENHEPVWMIVGTRLRRIVRASIEPEGARMYNRLFADRTGYVWMRLDAESGTASSARWLVFDGSGRELGEVRLPYRLTPLDIGADYVLGVVRRDDGSESIQLYGLRRH